MSDFPGPSQPDVSTGVEFIARYFNWLVGVSIGILGWMYQRMVKKQDQEAERVQAELDAQCVDIEKAKIELARLKERLDGHRESSDRRIGYLESRIDRKARNGDT